MRGWGWSPGGARLAAWARTLAGVAGPAPTASGAHLRIIRGVRGAVRSRLLLANVAGGSVVLAYGQIAVGRKLAPDIGLLATFAAFAGTFVVSAVLANLWAYMGFESASVAAGENLPACRIQADQVLWLVDTDAAADIS